MSPFSQTLTIGRGASGHIDRSLRLRLNELEDIGSNVNVGRGRPLSEVGIEVYLLGEGIVLTFGRCSSSVDKRHGLRTHFDLGLSRHGGTANIGCGRVRGIGINGGRLGLGCSRLGGWRCRSDVMINQRTNPGGSGRSGTSLSMMRDITNVGL